MGEAGTYSGLWQAAEHIELRRNEIERVLRTISTAAACRHEISATLRTLREAPHRQDAYIRPAPACRTVAVFMPGNMLLYSAALYGIVPSFACGNLLLRYGESAQSAGLSLWEILSPGVPPNIQLWMGDRDSFLGVAGRADAVVFCGTPGTAARVQARLGVRGPFLYLGSGMNPFVVTATADIPVASATACSERAFNGGRDCLCPDLFLVERPALGAFVECLRAKIANLKQGVLSDDAVEVCPITNDAGLRRTERFLERFRDRVCIGGTFDRSSGILEPTVVVHEPDSFHKPPEFFAPVWNILPCGTRHSLDTVLSCPPMTDRAQGITVFGEPTFDVPAAYSAVAYDTGLQQIDDGNEPFGGWGGDASYVAVGPKRFRHPVLVARELVRYACSRQTEGEVSPQR